jgi:hypothetical protein
MRMAQSLFADETAPDWAFSKRKGLKKWIKTVIKKITKSAFDFAPLFPKVDF